MMVTLAVTASRGPASKVEAIYSSHQRDLLTWLLQTGGCITEGQWSDLASLGPVKVTVWDRLLLLGPGEVAAIYSDH